MSAALLVYCTFPNADIAEQVAQTLVKERLVACVNLLNSVRSVYRWQGEICSEAECMTMAKTTSARFPQLQSRILELHPYDCPEVVAVEVKEGSEAYLRWIAEETELSETQSSETKASETS